MVAKLLWFELAENDQRVTVRLGISPPQKAFQSPSMPIDGTKLRGNLFRPWEVARAHPLPPNANR